jgi:dienelactone hydrolase
VNSARTLQQLLCLTFLFGIPIVSSGQQVSGPDGTIPLTQEGDLASLMVDGIDRFLLKEIEKAAASRADRFVVDTSSSEAYELSLKPHREKLAKCLGIQDARMEFDAPEVIVGVGGDPVIAKSEKFTVQAIRWPVLSDPSPQGQGLASITAEGLLLTPKGDIHANMIVVPDAEQTPEQLCGLTEGIDRDSQVARQLAESGCRVVVPALISRHREKRLGRADLTSREYLHRASFELGRTLAGYEVQMSLSMVDWYSRSSKDTPIGIWGNGEGGMEALFVAALDNRISIACVSGFFGPRESSWKEPIERNFAGLLHDFGIQELAMLVAPRRLVVQHVAFLTQTFEGNGGAPAELAAATEELVQSELNAAVGRAVKSHEWAVLSARSSDRRKAMSAFLAGICVLNESVNQGLPVQVTEMDLLVAAADRETQLFQQIDRHNQALLRESHFVRKEFMSKLDVSSVEAYEKSSEQYRDIFRKAVIGEFEQPLLPFNARSRKSWETDKWTGHEVMLDVFPDVFAYGVLLLPKDLKPGEKRPVVVCQHGLEGRPTDIFQGDHAAYHDFAAKLCERGFITFSPQNPYIFTDRFRTLQRKAQPLGKSLFSIIVPQHQQIVNWLKTQPSVDSDRIAFYGLSYGGKSAMRIPALVTDYCLSICSADFNEWVLKNASTRENFSYIWTGEYEIFEWDLGSKFNYAEMAALICPRPFMVERGHFDGVGEDHWVGYEYAKVRNLYAAQLKIGDKTEIEWFVGPHTINGQGSYRFLHKHLNWPEPEN